MSIASPLIALAITVVIGTSLFVLLGKDPLRGLAVFFVEPLQERLRAHRARGQGDAAAPDRARPRGLLSLQRLEHRRRRPVHRRRDRRQRRGDARGARTPAAGSSCRCSPAACSAAWLWAAIVALLRDRFNANEILVSLMLVYVAEQLLNYLVYGPWKDPHGYNFPQTITFLKSTQVPRLYGGYRVNIGALGRARRRRGVLDPAVSHLRGLPAAGRRPRPGGGALRRLLVAQRLVDGAAALGRHGRSRRRARGRRAARPADAARAGRLRLRRDHRRLRRPAASGRHRLLGDPDEHVLHRRRAGAVAPRPAEVADRRVPGAAAVHAARLRHADRLSHPLEVCASAPVPRAVRDATTRRSTRSSRRRHCRRAKAPDGPVRAPRRRDAQLRHGARVRRARPLDQRARRHRQPRRRRDDAGRCDRRLRDRVPHRQRLARLRRRRARRRACSRPRSACS